METNGPAVDLLSGLSAQENDYNRMLGQQQLSALQQLAANSYGDAYMYTNQGMNMAAYNQAQSTMRSLPILHGVLDDDEVKTLQARTRERQRTAFEALRASGKSLLSTPVKKRDSTSK